MYYEDYDENCFTIESGRYFEEIGLIRFSLFRDKQGVAHWCVCVCVKCLYAYI
jgi:hypothetical protein